MRTPIILLVLLPLTLTRVHAQESHVELRYEKSIARTLVYAIMEYRMDLADLNPEAIRVSDLGDYATVSMTVRDYQPKIKVFKHANENGMMGRTLEDALSETAIINLRDKAAALQFKNGLMHAIKLCHAQR